MSNQGASFPQQAVRQETQSFNQFNGADFSDNGVLVMETDTRFSGPASRTDTSGDDARAADLITQLCNNFKRFKVSEVIVAAGPQLS